MSRVKSTMQLIQNTISKIDNRYDMCAGNVNDIYNASRDSYELICNGFRFGYAQGMKAARAEQKARAAS
jgi:hypothetical protein